MKFIFMLLASVVFSSCSTSDLISYENEKYLKSLKEGISTENCGGYFFKGKCFIIVSGESGYGNYKIWMISLGGVTKEVEVVSARIVIADQEKKFENLDRNSFVKGADGNHELLLGNVDFKENPFKLVSDENLIHVYVRLKINGIDEIKIYSLNRVSRKMINYPT